MTTSCQKLNNEPILGMVSIIIPVYNCYKTIHRCLESILNQTYQNFEVILINDGSTDGTPDICNHYSKSNKKIIVINQDNHGVSNARNTGIRKCQGEYILFIDGDDWIEPQTLQHIVLAQQTNQSELTIFNFLKRSEVDQSSGHELYFNNDILMEKKEISSYVEKYIQTPYRFILLVHCWGKLYLSQIIREFNCLFEEKLHNFEDVDFNFMYITHVNRIYYIHSPLYNYSIQNNFSSQSFTVGNNFQHFRNFTLAFRHIESYLINNISHLNATKRRNHIYISCVIIILLRICGQRTRENKTQMLNTVRDIVNTPEVRNSLRDYTPQGGDTKLIPYLMRLKLIRPLIIISHFRYHQHRKKYKNVKVSE